MHKARPQSCVSAGKRSTASTLVLVRPSVTSLDQLFCVCQLLRALSIQLCVSTSIVRSRRLQRPARAVASVVSGGSRLWFSVWKESLHLHKFPHLRGNLLSLFPALSNYCTCFQPVNVTASMSVFHANLQLARSFQSGHLLVSAVIL